MYVEYLRVSGGRCRARGESLSLQVAVAASPRAGRGQRRDRPTSGVLESLAFSSRGPRERLSDDPRRRRGGAATRPRPIQRCRRGIGARRSAVETSFGAGAARLLGLLLLLALAGLLGRLRRGASFGPRAVRRRARSVQSLLEPSSTRRRRVSTRRRALADFLEGVFAIFECVGVCVFGAEEPRPVLEVLKL